MGRAGSVASRPGWLLDAPDGPLPGTPVVTRNQVLPFGDLSWQDFERLCLRLARQDQRAIDWRLFGEPGEEQGGIDILAREPASGRHVVWQVKRHRRFTEAKLRAAIREFGSGEWAGLAGKFVLATAASLRSTAMVKAQNRIAADLQVGGVEFEALDAERLSERLKQLPEVVDDFFGRAWVEAFCGRQAAERLEDRLDRTDYASLRLQLRDVYRAHFSSVDPGVMRAATPMLVPPRPLPLSNRFIPLDMFAGADPQPGRERKGRPNQREEETDGRDTRRGGEARAETPDIASRRRQPFATWCQELDRAIVIGAPGAGKSTLLRILALDMLEGTPCFVTLDERRRGYLPIWISFPFWTRLIAANEADGGVSAEDAITRWLQVQGEAGLVPLVRRALTDGRVVLLVDGVDEWSDEDAAGTALTLLHGLVERRGCPAVLTSRPYGERSFRMLDASWARRELAPMTPAQQSAFAKVWFETILEGDARRATIQAESFVDELRRSAQLAELAGIPLLFGGLIGLRLSGASLPRSRFQAYAELTGRLLESQPAARDKAALRPVRGDGLDREARDRAFAALAFHVQAATAPTQGLDAISKIAVTAFCTDHIEAALATPRGEALRLAGRLVTEARKSLGLLVDKSQDDLGFVHRVFQEFLAARHVSTLDFEEQMDVLRRHGTDPVWRDVLLFSVGSLTRVREVDAAVSTLEALRTGNRVRDWSVTLLLADIAFGGAMCGPRTAKRLALAAFEEVETGSEPVLRQELLHRVAAGSEAAAISAIVRAKLRQWFPSWHDANLAEALRMMVDWPEEAVDDVLWRNLRHTRFDVRTQAARALAARQGGDQAWRDRLLDAAREPQGFGTCAAALEALSVGWSHDSAVHEAVDLARLSEEATVLVGGVSAAIRLGRHSARDRERLCDLVSGEWGVPDGAGGALVAGWSRDPDLKSFLMRSGDGKRWGVHGSVWTLVEAFPQDDDVAEAIVEQGFFAERGFALHHAPEMLFRSFERHPRVAAAIEAGMDRYRADPRTLSWAARIAPTPSAKAVLLDTFNETALHKFWQADALVDLWGLGDPEVSSALCKALTWPTRALADLGHLLPRLIPDRTACRERLLAILRLASTDPRVRADQALAGLAALDVQDDAEVLNVALGLDLFSPKAGVHNSHVRLVQAFHRVPEVKELALANLRSREGLVNVMALYFGDDPRIRQEIIDVAAPLPEDMRLRLVDELADRAVEDDDALALLGEGSRESSPFVVGRCRATEARAHRARGIEDTAYEGRLVGDLASIGLYMDSSRLGAIGALALLGRADPLRHALCGGDRSPGMAFWSFSVESRLCATFAESWPFLEQVLGGDAICERLGLDVDTFFELFEAHIDGSPAMHAHARRLLDGTLAKRDVPSAAALRFAARSFPHDQVTLDLCLSAMSGGASWREFAPALTAGEVLGRTHADVAHVRDRLVGGLEGSTRSLDWSPHAGAIAYLCEGCPDSPTLDALFLHLRAVVQDRRPRLPTALALKLVATKSETVVAADRLGDAANGMNGELWDGYAYWVPNFVRRLKTDDALHDELLRRLASKPTPNEKVSFASLLAAARGYSGPLVEWCAGELTRAASSPVPQTGLDVTLGAFRFVPQRLREVGRA